jgi:hypothetical protein
MIASRTAQIYDWFDIQNAICDRMGIGHEYFRDYHKIVGGDYKDLWHLALDKVVPQFMANGTIVTMYALEDWPDNQEWYLTEHGNWAAPFFDAYNQTMQSIDPDFRGVLVEFCW